MLLYVHVPFCKKRCLYCAFSSQAVGNGPLPDDFIPLLLEEIELWAADPLTRTAGPVTSVFFGGGTPSLLAARDIGRVLDRAAQRFNFDKDIEITLEGNPESLRDPGRIADYAAAGVNRFSMGAQSMHDADLRLLGRIHDAACVREARMALRAAPCASVNIDLMWGLPGQTTSAWLDTLRAAINLEPDHLSCYALTLEDGTPMAERQWHGACALPDEEECASMYLEGCQFMETHGLAQYEISNFAAPGCQCRHNLGYWHGLNYAGAGPAAVASMNNLRRENPSDYACWRKRVQTGSLWNSAQQISAHDRLFETVMLRLRTIEGLPMALYSAATGREFKTEHARLLAELESTGLAVTDKNRVRLTRRGLLVSNDIVARLFETMDLSLDTPCQ